MARKKYELTGAEWAIIRAVWENQPCAAPTVQEVLESERAWSYSTVKTLMDRMVTKELLKTKKLRNLILYSAVVTRKQAQHSEIMRTVKRAFDGALTPMMQFLIENDQLSRTELKQLESMVKTKKSKSKK